MTKLTPQPSLRSYSVLSQSRNSPYLCNPKVHYHIHRHPKPVPVMSQGNTVPACPSIYLQVCSIINLTQPVCAVTEAMEWPWRDSRCWWLALERRVCPFSTKSVALGHVSFRVPRFSVVILIPSSLSFHLSTTWMCTMCHATVFPPPPPIIRVCSIVFVASLPYYLHT